MSCARLTPPCSSPCEPLCCCLPALAWRAGRKGKTGIATSFINKNQSEHILLDLKHLLREAKQRIPPVLQALHDPMDELAVSAAARIPPPHSPGQGPSLCCALHAPLSIPALNTRSPTHPPCWLLAFATWHRRWRPSAAPRAAPTAAAWATASPTAPSCGQTRGSSQRSSRTGLATTAAAAASAPKCEAEAAAGVQEGRQAACGAPLAAVLVSALRLAALAGRLHLCPLCALPPCLGPLAVPPRRVVAFPCYVSELQRCCNEYVAAKNREAQGGWVGGWGWVCVCRGGGGGAQTTEVGHRVRKEGEAEKDWAVRQDRPGGTGSRGVRTWYRCACKQQRHALAQPRKA